MRKWTAKKWVGWTVFCLAACTLAVVVMAVVLSNPVLILLLLALPVIWGFVKFIAFLAWDFFDAWNDMKTGFRDRFFGGPR